MIASYPWLEVHVDAQKCGKSTKVALIRFLHLCGQVKRLGLFLSF